MSSISPKPTEPERQPLHVAIIMDGNGRWARARGLPRTIGHQQGVEAVRRTIEAACELGIGYLTLFGFSSENWNRPLTEVGDLMGLLRLYLTREIADLHGNGVRLRIVGDRGRLAPDIVAMIERAEALTRGNERLHLTVALSYGGRDEIVAAARRLAERVRDGDIATDDIDEGLFQEHLETGFLPPPDLLIRTSGEKRLSNFMLWQCAYAEFVFLDTLWPDFRKEHLDAAIAEYGRRERRYGAISA
jgi:undecaprenyl diphosphate synthase